MASIHSSTEALVKQSRANPSLQGRVYVGVTLPEKQRASTTPILVPLPNKYKRNDEEMACLVVKDPQKTYTSILDQSELTNDLFSEVIGVGKLRRRIHGSNKKMEEFTKSFPLLLCQDRAVPPLLEVLGPRYAKSARYLPIPISLDPPIDLRKIKTQVRQIRRSTQIVLKNADFISLHVGHTLMDEKKLEENIQATVKFVKKKWPGAKMHIKTPNSVSLPISID